LSDIYASHTADETLPTACRRYVKEPQIGTRHSLQTENGPRIPD
jgi:hypothetical protein